MWLFIIGLLILISISILFGIRIAAITFLVLIGIFIVIVLVIVQDGYNREAAYKQQTLNNNFSIPVDCNIPGNCSNSYNSTNDFYQPIPVVTKPDPNQHILINH